MKKIMNENVEEILLENELIIETEKFKYVLEPGDKIQVIEAKDFNLGDMSTWTNDKTSEFDRRKDLIDSTNNIFQTNLERLASNPSLIIDKTFIKEIETINNDFAKFNDINPTKFSRRTRISIKNLEKLPKEVETLYQKVDKYIQQISDRPLDIIDKKLQDNIYNINKQIIEIMEISRFYRDIKMTISFLESPYKNIEKFK